MTTRWIFGYGSLMWMPGFSHAERRPALLQGYHRDFCMRSTRNRGTTESPGMVLSLAPGGAVTGIAFRYDTQREPEVHKYLDEREGLDRAHKRVVVPLRLVDGAMIPAWTYLPMLANTNYDGRLPLAERVRLVAVGRGALGTSYDYLRLLLEELAKLDVREPGLEHLFDQVNRALAPNGGMPRA